MDLLRNKSNLTRLQIILEIILDRPGDQRTISAAVGITPQAVSEYLRKMEGEGLVDLSERAPRATVKGVDQLQSSLLRLKDYIDTSISKLSIIRSTDAIASTDLAKGERAGLVMIDGLLHAVPYTGKGSSGEVDNDALKGEMVSISSLTGVMDLPRAMLFTLDTRPVRQGGKGERVDKRSFRSYIKKKLDGKYQFPRIAVLDLEAAAFMKRSGIEYSLEMPGTHTLTNHMERGISLVLVGTPYSLSSHLKRLSLPDQEIIPIELDN